jgi:hypothetical protein
MSHNHYASADAQGHHGHDAGGGYPYWDYRWAMHNNGSYGTSPAQITHTPGSGLFVLAVTTYTDGMFNMVPEVYAGSHAHNISVAPLNGTSGSSGTLQTDPGQGGGGTGAGGNLASETVGVAAADRNLPPFITVNYIIKT